MKLQTKVYGNLISLVQLEVARVVVVHLLHWCCFIDEQLSSWLAIKEGQSPLLHFSKMHFASEFSHQKSFGPLVVINAHSSAFFAPELNRLLLVSY